MSATDIIARGMAGDASEKADDLDTRVTALENDPGITVDTQVDSESTNPVENRAIYNFVNSSVSTNTANFIGTFNSLADLEAYSGTVTNNDYAFVISTDTAGNTIYNRYKYQGSTETWAFEYSLSNAEFTASQWAAINSGMTSGDKTKLTGIEAGANKTIVDDALSTSSTNPVQNKVIKEALDTKYDKAYDIELSQAEYDALGTEKFFDNKNYYVPDADDYPVENVVVYGFHIDPAESDPSTAITYLEDAVGMTPASMGSTAFNYGSWKDAFFMPKPCMVKNDGTVDYYLDPNDYTKKADGTASDVANLAYEGNVMMEWPLIFWKWEQGETEGEGYFYCSNRKIDDSYDCYCNVNCDDQVVEHFYTAIYNGTIAPKYDSTKTYAVDDLCTQGGSLYKCVTAVKTAEAFDSTKWTVVSAVTPLRSVSGLALTANNGNGSTTFAEESTRAMANNTTVKTEWYIDVWADRVLINGLLVLMGKSLNTQAVFGRGLDSGSQTAKETYTTGSLNDKGLFWGSTSSGSYGVKVFGMENWWGCVYHRTAGLIGVSNNNYAYKMTWGRYDGTSATGYNTNAAGYKTVGTRPATNYFNKAKFGQFGFLPIVTSSSSSTTYYSDYYYNGTGFALVGGNAADGANSGAFYVSLNAGAGYAAWGIAAALTLKPLA